MGIEDPTVGLTGLGSGHKHGRAVSWLISARTVVTRWWCRGALVLWCVGERAGCRVSWCGAGCGAECKGARQPRAGTHAWYRQNRERPTLIVCGDGPGVSRGGGAAWP